MKIIKTDGQSCLLKMTQSEWANIGVEQNWIETHPKKPRGTPAEAGPKPDKLPLIDDAMQTRIEKYTDKFWAVYLEGASGSGSQLLCVTAYLKGATAVKSALDQMTTRITELKGKLEDLAVHGRCELPAEVSHGNN